MPSADERPGSAPEHIERTTRTPLRQQRFDVQSITTRPSSPTDDRASSSYLPTRLLDTTSTSDANKASATRPPIENEVSSYSDDNNKENGPLRSHRDPRRTPLQSRIPFTPTPSTAGFVGTNGVRSGRKDITPAYAYKNSETGLLEIRTIIPPRLSMVANEDDTVDGSIIDLNNNNNRGGEKRLALYPIALNGGGAGLYRDPREFARDTGHNAGFSVNHRISRRAPMLSHVRFAWPSEVKKVAEMQKQQLFRRDIESGEINNDDDRSYRSRLSLGSLARTRQSLGSVASAINPWKLWENIHIEMSRLAALQTQRQEDEASHVTIARQRNKASRVSSVYNDDDFDFALVLTPHDAYAFWAKHLDFREEMLHLVEDHGLEIEELDQHDDESTIATATTGHGTKPELYTRARTTSTEMTPVASGGLRRRKNATPNSKNLINSQPTPSSTSRYQSHRSPLRAPRPSVRTFSQKKSLFERALDRFSPPGMSQRSLLSNGDNKEKGSPSPKKNGNKSPPSMQKSSPSPLKRRGWGNLTSPPIFGRASSAQKSRRQVGNLRGVGTRQSSFKVSSKRPRTLTDDDDINDSKDGEDLFFSSPGVPRGIAARVNGLGKFIEALKIGIVVRRHWPCEKSVYVLLFSDDGGDSIQFKYVPDDEAVIALKEQAQRYNVCRREKKARVSYESETQTPRMSLESGATSQKPDVSVPIPDYLKVKIDREEEKRKIGGFLNAIAIDALKRKNDLSIEAQDLVQVQPATHIDPFSKEGNEHGTSSLRQSDTVYDSNTTFSIIVPSLHGRFIRDYSEIDFSEKWCEGKRKSLFRSLDLEALTEGEYWMLLKGFILLHRDASTGRFAAQRASGFGSYYRYQEENGAADTQRFIEALPPPKTFIQRLIGKSQQDKIVPYNATAPPSDYFLGFTSPGTQIWGRLRQAGLETQRIYSLDTRKVMIKVRCPVDRLQDVAEALKLKLKTKEGEYAPFREEMIPQFASTDDGFVSCENDVQKLVSLFRSSERQKIIDFIIGSRIRDSGAELGISTKLGQQIHRRVPLHSHVRLEALYTSWVLFWYPSNWTERDEACLSNEKLKANSCPNILYRFFVGSFYQPLDEIEKYYGEKIAFYFAWLEHCSFHLLYLSVIGMIVFIVQLTSGKWDHWLRPYFSIVVMIWSFVVMVTWRRRSNYLAYTWGTLNYQEEEVTRPDFRGTKDVVCPVTNTYIPYYPPWKRWLMMCCSILLTFAFTMVTLLCILILYGNRDVMLERYFATGDEGSFNFSFSLNVIGGTAPFLGDVLDREHLHDPKFWFIMIGFPTVLAFLLPLLNFCLRRLALWLNEIENHRTEAEHQTHFIIKVFAFRFVCYFAALYYYSFIGVSVSGADDHYAIEHGILRVAANLVTYLTIANWWSIFLQVFLPLVLYRWRVFRERLHLRNELRSLEIMESELASENGLNKTADERLEMKKHLLNRRLLLEHAQVGIWEEMMLPEHDSFVDYLFATTQFAYVTCFSVVLPITPLIVLINHLLNMRLDAFKICRGRCRPLSQKTGGIGVWNHVLHVVTVLAILTNCSLMALTSVQFAWLKERIGALGVFALAIGWEHVMLLVKYIMQLTVSAMPIGIQNELKRKKYDQERTRYTTLRAKKERRSASVDVTPRHNDGGNKNGDNDKASTAFQTSLFPPIQESESDEASSVEMITRSRAATEPTFNLGKDEKVISSKRKIVSVRDMKVHSPPYEQNKSDSNFGVGLPSNIMRYEENDHPNLPRLTDNTPTQSLTSYMLNSNLGRSGAALLSSARQGYGSRQNVDIGQGQQQVSRTQEDVLSPDSTLSTIPRIPTPCQLNLGSDEDDDKPYIDDDTLCTNDSPAFYRGATAPSMSTRDKPYTDDDTLCTNESPGFYHGATAPPMSVAANGDYGTTSRSTRTSYFDDSSEGRIYYEDDDGTKAKWGIHHFAHFAKSERSLHVQNQKKSR